MGRQEALDTLIQCVYQVEDAANLPGATADTLLALIVNRSRINFLSIDSQPLSTVQPQLTNQPPPNLQVARHL